jgi:NAD(P)-dependent dehydrogenase (short-subunit alcohol dehydrogenase family)
MTSEAQGRLAGKAAFVTGGAGGIGQAVVARFLREGAQVLAADLRPPSGALPQGAAFVELDVTSSESVRGAMADAEQRFGRLDVLVNCAAIEIEKTLEETSEEEWDRLMAVNLRGTFLACKHALPLLREAGGGSIVNFGSYDGFIADPGLAAYCASKGGVHALTKAIAVDYGPEGIRCNAVCPGYVDTPMLQSFFGSSGDIESLKGEVRGIHPIRRYGTPEDAANLVLWLASDEAGYASGQLWILDGGLTAQAQQMRL